MNKPLISVIVAIYNSGENLKYLIDSILVQYFRDYELLLVDDGSTDGVTPKMCDELAEMDNRIKVFHKPNGGVSDTRNYGLDHANGTFVAFADHDDYMFPDNLQTMVEEIGDLDLLICDYTYGPRKNIHSCNRRSKKTWEVVAASSKEMTAAIPKIGYKHTNVWNQLFRRSIIEQNHLRFQNIQGEDELFSFMYLSCVMTLKRIDYVGYYWVDTPNSQGSSHKYIVEMNWISQMESIYEKIEKKYPPGDFQYILNMRIAHRLAVLCFKGYHIDSHMPFCKRIKVWNSVRQDRWLQKRIVLSKLGRNDALVLWIARLRLQFVLDPLFLLFICIRDRKLI